MLTIMLVMVAGVAAWVWVGLGGYLVIECMVETRIAQKEYEREKEADRLLWGGGKEDRMNFRDGVW